MTRVQWLLRPIVLVAMVGSSAAIRSEAGAGATPEFQVSGAVAEFPLGCQGAMRGVTVRLEPLGLEVQTSLVDGTFAFAAVAQGDYSLTVSPSCNPFGCWAETAVNIVDQDVFRRICPEAPATSPTPTDTPTVTPTSNRPPAVARGIATPNPARSGQEVSLLDDGSIGGVAGRRWDQRDGPLVVVTGFPPTFVAPEVTEPVVIAFDYSVCNFDSGCDIDPVTITILPPDCPGDCVPTATPTPSITPTGFPFSTPTIACELSIEPTAPGVGDTVRVTVRRMSNGLGYPQYGLEPNPLFAGGNEQQSTATFEREAVQAGVTMLRGSTLDEFIVGYNGDQPIYSFYPAFCSVLVEVVAPTVTSTPTPTVTSALEPTATRADGSDGCQLDRGRGGGVGSITSLLALALIAGLRRFSRRQVN